MGRSTGRVRLIVLAAPDHKKPSPEVLNHDVGGENQQEELSQKCESEVCPAAESYGDGINGKEKYRCLCQPLLLGCHNVERLIKKPSEVSVSQCLCARAVKLLLVTVDVCLQSCF